jgi:hypothetical protein
MKMQGYNERTFSMLVQIKVFFAALKESDQKNDACCIVICAAYE